MARKLTTAVREALRVLGGCALLLLIYLAVQYVMFVYTAAWAHGGKPDFGAALEAMICHWQPDCELARFPYGMVD